LWRGRAGFVEIYDEGCGGIRRPPHLLGPLVSEGCAARFGGLGCFAEDLTFQNYSSFTSTTILMPKPILDFACFSEGVDLARIVEFINTYDMFQREDGDFSTRHINWQLAHLDKCTTDRGCCGCPPEPEGPIEPTLEHY
jgi:hypothetical protein